MIPFCSRLIIFKSYICNFYSSYTIHFRYIVALYKSEIYIFYCLLFTVLGMIFSFSKECIQYKDAVTWQDLTLSYSSEINAMVYILRGFLCP
jgi:hypothetical protein